MTKKTDIKTMNIRTVSKKSPINQPRGHVMRATALFKMRVPINVFKGESAYIARCPIFDVVSQGRNESEARKNIVEALVLFIETCYSKGTLDNVLKQSGFKKATGVAFRDKDHCLDKGQKLITVPLPLLMQQNSSLQECQSV